MKKVSILLKITGGLMVAAGVIHFLFGLTFLHFFSTSVTMGAVPRERMPILVGVLVSAFLSSTVILIAGIVAEINSAEPLKASQSFRWAVYALCFGIVSEIFVRLFGYESSAIYTGSGIWFPLVHLFVTVVFWILARKGYRLGRRGTLNEKL